jgi:hypothetical protein
MEITFADHRVQEQCESEAALRRAHGNDCAHCVMARLADLESAATLEELRRLPGRCRELDGARRGSLAIELAAGKELVLAPAGRKRKARVPDWREVEAVSIMTIPHAQQEQRPRRRPRGGGPR